MQQRLPVRLILPVILCMALAVPAAADGPQTLPEGADALPFNVSGVGCTVIPHAPGNLLYVWGSTERLEGLYQLVQPSDCPDCNGSSIQINSVVFRSRTAGDPTCEYDVEVSVVGATAGACPAPDESIVLCPPEIVTVSLTNTTGPVVAPLPGGCCIDGPAFVRIRWQEQTTCGSGLLHPIMLNSADACGAGNDNDCEEYFYTTTAHPAIIDACSQLNSPYYIEMETECCAPTPTRPETWGRMKTLYR